MSYTETLDRLASATEAQLLAAWDAWQDGRLTEDQFRAVALGYLDAAANRGAALADVALSTYLSVVIGTAVAPVGLTPAARDHAPDLDAALADDHDTRGRMGRTGRAVALAAAQDAYSDGMREHDVPAWTRVPNSGACQMCRDLSGTVLPASTPMYHHLGCGCTQQPVLNR